MAAFNRQQFAALAIDHPMSVVVPVSWLGSCQDFAAHRRVAPRLQQQDALEVRYSHYWYLPKIFREYQGQFLLNSIRRTVRRVIDHFQPEVLLGCWAYPDGWATVRLAREAGLPVAVKVHGSDVLALARAPARRHLAAETLRGADRVLTVSQHLAEHVIGLGVPASNVQIVRNGVDFDLFSPGDREQARLRLGVPQDRKIVLFVGNLLISKGTGVLVEACDSLRRRGTRFLCYMVGAGSDERRLRALIDQRGLGDCVGLVGQCNHRQLPDWYRASNLVALPSFSEGLPNVLQEALACERPFVATGVGGIPEIAHPSYSRLVRPDDAEELADALAWMLANPLPVDRGLIAERLISWRRSAELLAEALKKAVAARSRRANASC